MGNTIRPSAAAADIFKDTQSSYTKATAHHGVALSLADQTIAPVLTVAANVDGQIKTVKASAETVLAALEASGRHAGDLVKKVADDLWNAVGRPATDPYLSVLLPGGSSFYVDGDVSEQPDKMLLFVELLRANIHPRLAKADADAAANAVEAEAAVLRAAVDAAQGPRTKLQLLERVYVSLARVAALQLAAYKRMLKANGFTEADIHKIVPDRPRSEGKGAKAPAAPAPAAPVPVVAAPAAPAPAAPAPVVAAPAAPAPAAPAPAAPAPAAPAPAAPAADASSPAPAPNGGT